MLSALAPRSWRERLRVAVSRGWSVLQVYERLGTSERLALAGPSDGEPSVVRQRRAVEALRTRLLRLVHEGKVQRRTGHYATEFKSKGQRDVVVDLFRLA